MRVSSVFLNNGFRDQFRLLQRKKKATGFFSALISIAISGSVSFVADQQINFITLKLPLLWSFNLTLHIQLIHLVPNENEIAIRISFLRVI